MTGYMRKLSREEVVAVLNRYNFIVNDIEIDATVDLCADMAKTMSPARCAVTIVTGSMEAPVKPSVQQVRALLDMVDEMTVPTLEPTPER